jgi:hypothetical protein
MNGPFRKREEFIISLKQECLSNTEIKGTNLISNLENSMLLIGDPFNRSYNPAKIKAHSHEADTYDSAFKTAFL